MSADSLLRNGEIVQAILQILSDHGQLRGSEAISKTRDSLMLTEYEQGEYESKPGVQRFEAIARFKTIAPVKAGWIVKAKDGWLITDEGKEALVKFTDPSELYTEASKAYKLWKKNRDELLDDEDVDELQDVNVPSVTFEMASETAAAEIHNHLVKISPYEFQDLVAVLLTAMGYYVSWVSPPGKDGGIDIVAHTDKLGADGPRIKVQVKQRSGGAIGAPDLRSFLAVIGQQDVGIFVTTNSFSKDAQTEARNQDSRRLMLIDGHAFVDLWIDHFDQLDAQGQAMLPIRPVYFLSN